MLCDFTAGVSAVSLVNLASRGAVRPMMHPFLQEMLMCLRRADFVSFEAMHTGSWHSRFPGGTRARLDPAGLVFLCDTQLVPSLADIRTGQERWDHRVQNTPGDDLSVVKSRLKTILIRPECLSSGMDWRPLVRVIVNRNVGRLELTRYLLNLPVTDPDEISPRLLDLSLEPC